MTGNKWTFLFVKDHETPVRQFTVSPRTVQYAIGGFLGVVLLLAGLSVTLGFRGVTEIKRAHLEDENELLTAELERLRSEVGELEGRVSTLAERDAEYRILAGLDTIDEEVLEVGVGGPGTETPEDHPLWDLDPALSGSAFAVSYDVNALARRTRLLSESLEEATDSLVAHRDLMERLPSIFPTEGLVSSGFSQARLHPVYRQYRPHPGVDISAPAGTPILAAAKGTVRVAGYEGGYGLTVEIDHGYGYRTRYGHSSKLLVQRGQAVERGDVIALVGQTGVTTAPHLHYEVRVGGEPKNPLHFVLDGPYQ